MDILIHPTYFASVSHYVAMLQAENIVFEADDHFQKQTNRNRMYIYSANGLQLLNIPIKHSKEQLHQKYRDVKIENDFNWQKQHFKSLEAGYRTSPYFEFFEDDIRPIFEKKHSFLMDLNLEIHEIVANCLGIQLPYTKTEEYFKEVSQTDFRHLANGKKDENVFDSYIQVFNEKHGFLNNLSILDLLFNEGRHAVDYLKEQTLMK
ncbi:WbqC family protein [Flavobacterium sp. CBA20B-1]|uniref:WbqC family protein n=1 Tax=unclassified Flavobacterium TaxID=196869 RepID=UPI002224BAA6|nr:MULTISPECIES: WbqC family protein [unclassified Flavobacterium]WCM42981.1 WbqC family protein [Flavobacterium sp. CBA20B-1]